MKVKRAVLSRLALSAAMTSLGISSKREAAKRGVPNTHYRACARGVLAEMRRVCPVELSILLSRMEGPKPRRRPRRLPRDASMFDIAMHEERKRRLALARIR